MKKNYYKCLITSILCVALITFTSFVPIGGMNNTIEHDTSEFKIFEDYIFEHDVININHEKVEIKKYTYPNNTALLVIKEKGEITKFNLSSNYNLLKDNLGNKAINQKTRAGLVEKYLTTFKSTDHVTPKNASYSAILGAVSAVLGFAGLPGSVATGIASVLFGLNASSVEAWITTERKFYEMYDSTGYFLGYYKVYYTIKTEAKVNGKRQLVDTEKGTYETTFPG
ncbi:MAG: hypothetical protein V8R64_14045 [Thomasclavelia sp.]